MTLTVAFHDRWDGAAMRTEALVPRGAHAVLLTFEDDPWPEEGGLPAALTAALADGLCACGALVGRWFDEVPPPPSMRFLPAPPAGVLRRLRDALPFAERSWPASLALTRSPHAALEFFETGWDMQYQALAVLREGADLPDPPVLEALRTARDWRDFANLDVVRALCAPAVDGAAVVISCASAAGLAEIVGTLEEAMRAFLR